MVVMILFLKISFVLVHKKDLKLNDMHEQKLQIMGISKIQDVLVANKSELEDVFESTIGDYRYS